MGSDDKTPEAPADAEPSTQAAESSAGAEPAAPAASPSGAPTGEATAAESNAAGEAPSAAAPPPTPAATSDERPSATPPNTTAVAAPAAGDGAQEPPAPTGNAPSAAGDATPTGDAPAAPGDAAPTGDAPTPTADAPAPANPATPPGGDSDAAASGPDGEKKKKKKRRRRKKKKPGAEASPDAPARPKGKPKPATDRAPFHVGEEVFGKVTAVLDGAIMIDISGKALGIFDRGEMEADDLIPAEGDRFVARVHGDGSRGGLVVLTRKPLRDEQAKPFVEQAQKDGTLIPGLVTGAIKGGVEVLFGGLRAFAPASGMDLHPAEANFASLVGQVLDFKVLEYAKGGRDVVVTRRPMLEAEAHERRKKALTLLEEGQVKKGVVRTVVEWGAFVALPEAENLEGLVHISEASHDPRAKMAEILKPGDKLDVKITKIDDKGKIWLSRKALIEDPWAEAKKKFSNGSKHQGKVTRVENFGAFVELEPGVEGLLHVADLAFKRVEDPKDLVSVGQELEVVVQSFDPKHKKVGLHPALTGEQAEEKRQKVSKGAVVDTVVVKGEQAGLQVRVTGVTGRHARGFIPAGHTGTSRGTDLRKKFKIGTAIRAKVLDVDPRRGEPKLSIRVLADDEERQAHREYRKQLQKEGGFGTLGDLLGAAMKK